MENAARLGTLCHIDVSGISPQTLDNLDYLKEVLRTAANKANVSVLSMAEHRFKPQGTTLMLLLSESHLTIHTWPEYEAAAIDFFTCGPRENIKAGVDYIIDALTPKKSSITYVERTI